MCTFCGRPARPGKKGKTGDRPPARLRRIAVDTRKAGQFTGSSKGAAHFGQSYLLSCLLRQSYTCVALREGRPVGVIVGADCRKGRKRWHGGTSSRALRHAVPLLFDRSFRRGNGEWAGHSETLAALHRAVGCPFGAELSLFPVDESCRGLGIGNQLYRHLGEHSAGGGIERFCAHTDTGCNHRFCGAQGLQRLAEAATKFSCAGVEKVTAFVCGQKKWGRLHKIPPSFLTKVAIGKAKDLDRGPGLCYTQCKEKHFTR